MGCQQIKLNYYQLKLHAQAGGGKGWDDKAFLRIYRNEAGIVVNGIGKQQTA